MSAVRCSHVVFVAPLCESCIYWAAHKCCGSALGSVGGAGGYRRGLRIGPSRDSPELLLVVVTLIALARFYWRSTSQHRHKWPPRDRIAAWSDWRHIVCPEQARQSLRDVGCVFVKCHQHRRPSCRLVDSTTKRWPM